MVDADPASVDELQICRTLSFLRCQHLAILLLKHSWWCFKRHLVWRNFLYRGEDSDGFCCCCQL